MIEIYPEFSIILSDTHKKRNPRLSFNRCSLKYDNENDMLEPGEVLLLKHHVFYFEEALLKMLIAKNIHQTYICCLSCSRHLFLEERSYFKGFPKDAFQLCVFRCICDIVYYSNIDILVVFLIIKHPSILVGKHRKF